MFAIDPGFEQSLVLRIRINMRDNRSCKRKAELVDVLVGSHARNSTNSRGYDQASQIDLHGVHDQFQYKSDIAVGVVGQ